jgi:hypothetical protein
VIDSRLQLQTSNFGSVSFAAKPRRSRPRRSARRRTQSLEGSMSVSTHGDSGLGGSNAAQVPDADQDGSDGKEGQRQSECAADERIVPVEAG